MNVDLQAARNYAEALFAAAKGQGILTEVREQAAVLRDALASEPRARAFLEAPHVPAPEKLRFAQAVLAGRFNPLLSDFVLLLLRKSRIMLFATAVELFITLAERDQGRWQGTVRTAATLDDEQRSRLQSALEKATGRSLVIEYQVDPSVIGGVVFKSGDLLMDNSIATQLGNLRECLMATRVH